MLIVKVMFYRHNKAPVTLDSKRIMIDGSMSINQMREEADNFYKEFIKEYPDFKNAHNIGVNFTLNG